MDEIAIVRSVLLRIGRGVSATAPLAQAVIEWAQPHAGWLFADDAQPPVAPGWDDLLRVAAEPSAPAAPCAAPLVSAAAFADALGLAGFDAALLSLAVAADRVPRVDALIRVVAKHGHDLPTLLGELAGAPQHVAAAAVRRSAPVRLGLIGFNLTRQGETEVTVRHLFERLLGRVGDTGPAMVDALLGRRQHATLELADFAHVPDAELLVQLLAGAVRERAAGINILIYGPPGTGKTELARTLAQAAGAPLHAVGEGDEDGDEPDRWERVDALQLAGRVLADRGGAVLLFDEMEDLIGDARPSAGDWFAHREGSKVFVNRLLETNPAPVIWTTNALGNVDGAILRRMSFVLKLDLPSPAAARRMLARVLADETGGADRAAGAAGPAPGFERLLDAAPQTASVLRVAVRAGQLAGMPGAGVRTAESLVSALRGGGALPPMPTDRLDLDLFETDPPLGPLVARLAAGAASDMSLLLTGPPGTGKTALAHHLARALDRPLMVKRASDLLSRWSAAPRRRSPTRSAKRASAAGCCCSTR